MAKIGDQLKNKDKETYNELKQLFKDTNKDNNKEKNKEKIELGDSIENLMRHDSHKRIGRRVRQVKWGGKSFEDTRKNNH
jgi:hypothetical protein